MVRKLFHLRDFIHKYTISQIQKHFPYLLFTAHRILLSGKQKMIKIAFSESGELFYILLAFLSTESSQLPSSLLACAIDRKKNLWWTDS